MQALPRPHSSQLLTHFLRCEGAVRYSFMAGPSESESLSLPEPESLLLGGNSPTLERCPPTCSLLFLGCSPASLPSSLSLSLGGSKPTVLDWPVCASKGRGEGGEGRRGEPAFRSVSFCRGFRSCEHACTHKVPRHVHAHTSQPLLLHRHLLIRAVLLLSPLSAGTYSLHPFSWLVMVLASPRLAHACY